MTDFSVHPSDLSAMSSYFRTAGSDIAHQRSSLLSGASGPESAAVVGDGAAASDYQQTLTGWGDALQQLESSLETISRKLAAAAEYYSSTEAGNTVQDQP